ncbi:L-serine ammonia-lyase [Hyphomicrobium sp.]|jgi:L-serine dehydratase|uniref:L-serine ammonia-lyase n=1 Tax=Hyphomicrobium sp. TaxID=82 RepID=UPI00356986D5
MNYSVFEVFRIGIGPSSSHTVGPMSAVNTFLAELEAKNAVQFVERVAVELYGSLALTGVGHATDFAVISGLLGETPEDADPVALSQRVAEVRRTKRLSFGGVREIAFTPETDLLFHRDRMLSEHPNGMTVEAFDKLGASLHRNTYFSIGGGAVLDQAELAASRRTGNDEVPHRPVRYAFSSAQELLALCQRYNLSIADIVWRNELAYQDEAATRAKILKVWQAMNDCLQRGLITEGILPGGLRVKRRAPALYRQACDVDGKLTADFRAMDMVSSFAIAVNEENAAGGRVVTAPTNGSAGVIPAVLAYYTRYCDAVTDADTRDDHILTFLLTAAGIGMLYKKNASISAAEMGCQGEIGVSCSMAAGGLAAVMGATAEQIENAAEIGMEHNLGMTCDPIGGLVQVPCIERNSMGAMKAINAARLAMMDDGGHLVSLDAVIETMRQTGHDLQSKYKETSLGGLAATVVYC